MDKNLSALKPALVWKHFAQIVRIPRPSSHEEKIRRYILDFARAQGLDGVFGRAVGRHDDAALAARRIAQLQQ